MNLYRRSGSSIGAGVSSNTSFFFSRCLFFKGGRSNLFQHPTHRKLNSRGESRSSGESKERSREHKGDAQAGISRTQDKAPAMLQVSDCVMLLRMAQ
jgi:hypothetical protein